MARVLVLGGTRFLGPPIVQRLVEGGHEVTVFHRGEREPVVAGDVQHVHGAFSQLPDFVSRLSRRRPEVVLDVVPYIDKGGHGVRHFVGSADRAVVVTSLDVYRAFAILWGTEGGNPPQPMPVTEDSATRAGRAPDLGPEIDFDNLEVEQALARDPALPVTVLRLPAIYGAGDPQRRLARYVRRMNDRRAAIVLDERVARLRWSRGYVENVAAAIVMAATDERAAGRIYNVAEPTVQTWAEWLADIANVCDWRGEVVALPREELPDSLRASWMAAEQDLYASSTRLREELGYEEPITIGEGLRRAVEWEGDQERDEPPPDYADEDRVLSRLHPPSNA